MPRLSALSLIVAASASVAVARPAVLLAPAVGTPKTVTVFGRALRHAPSQGSSTFSKNLRLLSSSNWEGVKVELRFAGQSSTVTSGNDGDFEATFTAPSEAPFAGVQLVEARVPDSEVASASVEIVDPEAPFLVVSDFDDTVAVTNVTNKVKLLETTLFRDARSQPAVEGMASFFGCLQADKDARPPLAFVSGSPVQHLGRVRSFLEANGFPVFGLYLRSFGLKTLRGYKQPVIRALLKRVPNKVVFVGDSGERDPEVYSEMRAEFPGRVVAIYIRNAGGSTDPKRFRDMVFFSDPEIAARDAVRRGLATEECVAKWTDDSATDGGTSSEVTDAGSGDAAEVK